MGLAAWWRGEWDGGCGARGTGFAGQEGGGGKMVAGRERGWRAGVGERAWDGGTVARRGQWGRSEGGGVGAGSISIDLGLRELEGGETAPMGDVDGGWGDGDAGGSERGEKGGGGGGARGRGKEARKEGWWRRRRERVKERQETSVC